MSSHDAKPPVVTVSCPSCGASVRDARPGDRTRCAYCGTDLHLPTFASDDPPPPDGPGEISPRARNALLAALGICLLAVPVVVVVMTEPPSSSQVPATPLPAAEPPSEDRDRELAGAKCLTDCSRPCTLIKNAQEMVGCFDACDAKCKLVGKGTGPECRARCADRCAGAPDLSSRGACESGCAAGCPP